MKKILKIASMTALSFALLFVLSGCAKSPEKVVKKMFEEMPKVESYYLDLQLAVSSKFPDVNNLFGQSVPGKLIVLAKGDVNAKNLGAMETTLDLDVKEDVGGKVIGVNGNVVYKNKNLFVKLLTAPKLGLFDLTSLKNNWYKIDLDTIVSSDSALVKNQVDEKKDKALRKLVAKTDFLKVVEDKGEIDLDSHKVHDYIVQINQKEVIEFFKESTKIIDERKLTDLEIADLEKKLKEFEKAKAEVWVGVTDYLLYKTVVSTEVIENNEKAVYDIVLKLDNMNQKVEIKEPTDVKVLDFTQLLFGGLNASLDQLGNGDILK